MPSLKKEFLDRVIPSLGKQQQDFNTFIETGTFNGVTTSMISTNFSNMEVYTIELSEHYHSMAKHNFSGNPKVHPIFGDSSVEMEKLLQKLTPNDSAIFWLDGHWSGGDTAKGIKDCPLIEECTFIDTLYKAEYGLVLIDDYRMFGIKANEDWSEISNESILNCFKNHSTLFFIDGDTMVIQIKKK